MAVSPPLSSRCATCELLTRSATPGLDGYGKCPHRSGWVRTHDAACEHHLAERPKLLVQVTMIANGVVAVLALGALVVFDVRNGTLATHLVVGAVAILLALFVWFVRRHDLASEEPKYQLLEQSDPPPEDDDRWWLDPR